MEKSPSNSKSQLEGLAREKAMSSRIIGLLILLP